MHEAAENQVLVTRTVKDLSLGSDLEFSPEDARQLKGIDEEIAVFSIA